MTLDTEDGTAWCECGEHTARLHWSLACPICDPDSYKVRVANYAKTALATASASRPQINYSLTTHAATGDCDARGGAQ